MIRQYIIDRRNSVPKRNLPLLFICIFCWTFSHPSFAIDQIPVNVVTVKKAVPAATGKKIVTDPTLTRFNPYNADFEKVLLAQEAILRKLKTHHLHKERKQHVRNTEKVYQEALTLYHHKRPEPARKVLAKVEDSMADYKSTDNLLKVIDDRSIERLKRKMYRFREVRAAQMELKLAQKATGIYQQAEYLGNDKNTIVVRKKLSKLVGTFQQMSNQVYIQQQLDKIAQEASDFDQEVYKLTQSSDYPAAKKKYEEFQQTMLNDLTKVKQNLAHENNSGLGVMSPQE